MQVPVGLCYLCHLPASSTLPESQDAFPSLTPLLPCPQELGLDLQSGQGENDWYFSEPLTCTELTMLTAVLSVPEALTAVHAKNRQP